MSRAARHPDAEELRRTFERLLASGGRDGLPSCTGLDSETFDAIQQAWDSPSLDAAARHEFTLRRNGIHAAEARPRDAAHFAAGPPGGGLP